VGCLIARRDALARLRRPWFAGGTIAAASVLAGRHSLAEGEAAFEDGTIDYLGLPAVEIGLRHLESIGIETIHERVCCLAGWLLDRLPGLRHGNGQPLVRLYGPATTEARGGTITFNFLDAGGRHLDHREIAGRAAAARISLHLLRPRRRRELSGSGPRRGRLLAARRAFPSPTRTWCGARREPTGAVRVSLRAGRSCRCRRYLSSRKAGGPTINSLARRPGGGRRRDVRLLQDVNMGQEHSDSVTLVAASSGRWPRR
jgi:selenocysteine lyase/cysteine desulfurase